MEGGGRGEVQALGGHLDIWMFVVVIFRDGLSGELCLASAHCNFKGFFLRWCKFARCVDINSELSVKCNNRDIVNRTEAHTFREAF